MCHMALPQGACNSLCNSFRSSGDDAGWPTAFTNYSTFERFLDDYPVSNVSNLGSVFEQSFESHLDTPLSLDHLDNAPRTDPLAQLYRQNLAASVHGGLFSSENLHSPYYYFLKEVNSARSVVDSARIQAKSSLAHAPYTRSRTTSTRQEEYSLEPIFTAEPKDALCVGARDPLGIDRLDEFPPLPHTTIARAIDPSSLSTVPLKTRTNCISASTPYPQTMAPPAAYVPPSYALASSASSPRSSHEQRSSDMFDNSVYSCISPTPTKATVRPLLSIETGPPPGLLTLAGSPQLITKVHSRNPLFFQSLNDPEQSSMYKFDFMAQHRSSPIPDSSNATPESSRLGMAHCSVAQPNAAGGMNRLALNLTSADQSSSAQSSNTVPAVDSYMEFELATSTTSAPATRSLNGTIADASDLPIQSAAFSDWVDENQQRTHSEDDEDSEEEIECADVEDDDEENVAEDFSKQSSLGLRADGSSASTHVRKTASRTESDEVGGEWVTKMTSRNRRPRLADGAHRLATSLRSCTSQQRKRNNRAKKTVLTFASSCATGHTSARGRSQKLLSYSDAVTARPSIGLLCTSPTPLSLKQSAHSSQRPAAAAAGAHARRNAGRSGGAKKVLSRSSAYRASIVHVPQRSTRALPLSLVKPMISLYRISMSSSAPALESLTTSESKSNHLELRGIAIIPNNERHTPLSSASSSHSSRPFTLYVAHASSDSVRVFDVASMRFIIRMC